VVLGDLGGKILLALKQGSDVALKLDEFAGDGESAAREKGAREFFAAGHRARC